ncbi:hypothetical protein [Tessaracoccus defluvii]|uniref:Uncharacterized protein n=1 Tax=Tessaracoccus defluvii TaxID=1285901 RepID=A0A7H0H956_9ACTN|nr:hypothetical protein [Tessaracoccus defluvii]QNP57072.1 hypothetical protein H9L22_07155 [Tessaracoccus defluvii]
MTAPTPRAAAPSTVRRQELVTEAMAGLEGIEALPLAEQASRLSETQLLLAAVLNNEAPAAQAGLPGVGR